MERSDWLLSVDGAVEEPYVLDWATLIDGPQTDRTGDIHCVTRWSKFGMHCRGMLVAEVVERGPWNEERHSVGGLRRLHAKAGG